jgi:ketosteroid isomerase-like protein
VPNGGPIVQGKTNIAKDMAFLDQKDNPLIWKPVGADISASGDLGYNFGTYELHSKDKEGKPLVEHSKYTSIWKKQKDGRWKVVLDTGMPVLIRSDPTCDGGKATCRESTTWPSMITSRTS